VEYLSRLHGAVCWRQCGSQLDVDTIEASQPTLIVKGGGKGEGVITNQHHDQADHVPVR